MSLDPKHTAKLPHCWAEAHVQKKGRTSLQVMELQYLSIEINPPLEKIKEGSIYLLAMKSHT